MGFLSLSGGTIALWKLRVNVLKGCGWLLARVSLPLFAVWSGVCPVVSLEGSLSLSVHLSPPSALSMSVNMYASKYACISILLLLLLLLLPSLLLLLPLPLSLYIHLCLPLSLYPSLLLIFSLNLLLSPPH